VVVRRLTALLNDAHVETRECLHCGDVDLPSQFWRCPASGSWYCKPCYHDRGHDTCERAAPECHACGDVIVRGNESDEPRLCKRCSPGGPWDGDSARCECERTGRAGYFVHPAGTNTWICARCEGLTTHVCHGCGEAYIEEECVECLVKSDEWDCSNCKEICRGKAGVPNPPPKEYRARELNDAEINRALEAMLVRARVWHTTCSLCFRPGPADFFVKCHAGTGDDCCKYCAEEAAAEGTTLCRVDCSDGRRARPRDPNSPEQAPEAAQAGPDSDSEAE